jgi:hypothetical protein
MLAARRIINYLKTTENIVLQLRPGDTSSERLVSQLRGYVDSAYASTPDWRSQYCYGCDPIPCDEDGNMADQDSEEYNTGLFCVKSAVNRVIALASRNADVTDMVKCAKTAVVLRFMWKEQGHPQLYTTPLYNDNKSAINVTTEHSGEQKKMKYTFPQITYLMDVFNEKIIKQTYKETTKLQVDIGTKAVVGTDFKKKRKTMLGNK